MRTLVWLRSDLRTHDNTALHHAAQSSSRGVVCAYVISPEDWTAHDTAAVRVDFVLRSLRRLSDDLHALGIPLVVAHAAHRSDVCRTLLELARASRCDALRWNIEYEVNESRRDERVAREFSAAGSAVHAHHDQTIVPPDDIRTKEGGFYTVFTPFKRAWLRTLEERGVPAPLPAPARQAPMGVERTPVPATVVGFESPVDAALWPAGEEAARDALARFGAAALGAYKADRDLPARHGTSRLSPHLAVGTISARQCLLAALDANHHRLDGGLDGPATWISELVWREFYRHVLVGYPRVSMGRAFRTEMDRVKWSNDRSAFERWATGATGAPIVDAGMRQLLATGWMHNRLRMITAMYLTKDLLIDWRWGERHFMRHLVDGDLAQNNGGWQWSASTGTDAAPYFRIFNPASQSRRFDPRGECIRRYVPELARLDDDAIHDPSLLPAIRRSSVDYPEPIIDHGAARLRAIAAYKAAADRPDRP